MDDTPDRQAPPPPAAPVGPPAGWYPQPGTTDQRYWDGASWTEHTAPIGAAPAAQSDENTLAPLPYFLGIFLGFLPALVLYFIRKDAPRVRFNSAQVLNLELVLFVIQVVGMGIWTVGIVSEVTRSDGADPSFAPGAFFLVWLVLFLLVLLRMGLYLWLGILAHRGEDRRISWIPRIIKP